MDLDPRASRGARIHPTVPKGCDVSTTQVRRDSTAAAVAVGSLFAINGVVIGGYAGVLAGMRARFDIDAGTLAILLFCVGVAAVASMQVGGRMADRVGARTVTLAVTPVLVLGAVLLALAPSFPLAVAAGMVLGLGNGAMDVGMNAIGVEVEKERPKPVMSRFHAFWSLGSFAGSGVVLATAALVGDEGWSVVTPALLTVAAIGALAFAVTVRSVPYTPPISHVTEEGTRTPIPPIAWLLGGMAVCFGLMEGTAYDWSSIHVADVAQVDPGLAAVGLVTVCAFMVGMRLMGDSAVSRVGHQAVVRGGALCAVLGYTITAFTTALPAILLGWALVGFGVAMIAPQIYAAAGHLGGGRMLAVVVTFGYAAFLAGPAILGWLVHTYGVQRAMLLPLVLGFVLVVLSRWMPAVGVHATSRDSETSEPARAPGSDRWPAP